MDNKISAIFQCISFHTRACKEAGCTASADALSEFDKLCAAEARAAQLEGERDMARKELRELQSHHTSIVLTLYEIDEEVFGPLTVKEGIAELKQQRDEARRALAQHQQTRAELIETVDALRRENEVLEGVQHEVDRLTRFLLIIIDIGDKDRHVAFDGERWREMRHCANQALMTKNEEYMP